MSLSKSELMMYLTPLIEGIYLYKNHQYKHLVQPKLYEFSLEGTGLSQPETIKTPGTSHGFIRRKVKEANRLWQEIDKILMQLENDLKKAHQSGRSEEEILLEQRSILEGAIVQLDTKVKQAKAIDNPVAKNKKINPITIEKDEREEQKERQEKQEKQDKTFEDLVERFKEKLPELRKIETKEWEELHLYSFVKNSAFKELENSFHQAQEQGIIQLKSQEIFNEISFTVTKIVKNVTGEQVAEATALKNEVDSYLLGLEKEIVALKKAIKSLGTQNNQSLSQKQLNYNLLEQQYLLLQETMNKVTPLVDKISLIDKDLSDFKNSDKKFNLFAGKKNGFYFLYHPFLANLKILEEKLNQELSTSKGAVIEGLQVELNKIREQLEGAEQKIQAAAADPKLSDYSHLLSSIYEFEQLSPRIKEISEAIEKKIPEQKKENQLREAYTFKRKMLLETYELLRSEEFEATNLQKGAINLLTTLDNKFIYQDELTNASAELLQQNLDSIEAMVQRLSAHFDQFKNLNFNFQQVINSYGSENDRLKTEYAFKRAVLLSTYNNLSSQHFTFNANNMQNEALSLLSSSTGEFLFKEELENTSVEHLQEQINSMHVVAQQLSTAEQNLKNLRTKPREALRKEYLSKRAILLKTYEELKSKFTLSDKNDNALELLSTFNNEFLFQSELNNASIEQLKAQIDSVHRVFESLEAEISFSKNDKEAFLNKSNHSFELAKKQIHSIDLVVNELSRTAHQWSQQQSTKFPSYLGILEQLAKGQYSQEFHIQYEDLDEFTELLNKHHHLCEFNEESFLAENHQTSVEETKKKVIAIRISPPQKLFNHLIQVIEFNKIIFGPDDQMNSILSKIEHRKAAFTFDFQKEFLMDNPALLSAKLENYLSYLCAPEDLNEEINKLLNDIPSREDFQNEYPTLSNKVSHFISTQFKLSPELENRLNNEEDKEIYASLKEQSNIKNFLQEQLALYRDLQAKINPPSKEQDDSYLASLSQLQKSRKFIDHAYKFHWLAVLRKDIDAGKDLGCTDSDLKELSDYWEKLRMISPSQEMDELIVAIEKRLQKFEYEFICQFPKMTSDFISQFYFDPQLINELDETEKDSLELLLEHQKNNTLVSFLQENIITYNRMQEVISSKIRSNESFENELMQLNHCFHLLAKTQKLHWLSSIQKNINEENTLGYKDRLSAELMSAWNRLKSTIQHRSLEDVLKERVLTNRQVEILQEQNHFLNLCRVRHLQEIELGQKDPNSSLSLNEEELESVLDIQNKIKVNYEQIKKKGGFQCGNRDLLALIKRNTVFFQKKPGTEFDITKFSLLNEETIAQVKKLIEIDKILSIEPKNNEDYIKLLMHHKEGQALLSILSFSKLEHFDTKRQEIFDSLLQKYPDESLTTPFGFFQKNSQWQKIIQKLRTHSQVLSGFGEDSVTADDLTNTLDNYQQIRAKLQEARQQGFSPEEDYQDLIAQIGAMRDTLDFVNQKLIDHTSQIKQRMKAQLKDWNIKFDNFSKGIQEKIKEDTTITEQQKEKLTDLMAKVENQLYSNELLSNQINTMEDTGAVLDQFFASLQFSPIESNFLTEFDALGKTIFDKIKDWCFELITAILNLEKPKPALGYKTQEYQRFFSEQINSTVKSEEIEAQKADKDNSGIHI